jgi:hypothetical protein
MELKDFTQPANAVIISQLKYTKCDMKRACGFGIQPILQILIWRGFILFQLRY